MKRMICAVLAALLLCCAAGCGGGGGETADPDAVYSLSEFTLADAEYGEFYKFDTSGIKVLDESGKETGLTVSVSSLVWPNGRETRLAGSSAKLTELGEYTVNYQVKGTSQIFPKTLLCKDSKGPDIALGETIFLPKTAVIGQEVCLPSGTASDLIGVEGDVTFAVTDPDGEPVEVAGGRIVTAKAGTYAVTYSATDVNGNIAARTETFTVEDIAAEEDVAGYMHTAYGVKQGGGMYRHEEYIQSLFVADVTQQMQTEQNGVEITAGGIPALPDGTKAATLVTPSADVQRVTWCVSSALPDLTDYDYLGMWVYNDSPKNMRVSLNYHSANDFTVKPGQWTYVAFNINAFDYSDFAFCAYNDTGMGVIQERDAVKLVTFRFDYEWSESEFLEDDDYGYRQKGYADLGFDLYMGKLVAGTFSDGEIAAYDKPYGAAFFTDYTATEYPVVSDSYYRYVTDVKEAGTEGSTLFESAAAAEALPLQLYMFRGEVKEENSYMLWVKNANDYAIVFDDGNGNKTAVPTGAEALVPVKPYATSCAEWQGAGLYNAKITAESGILPAETKVYLGALRETP